MLRFKDVPQEQMAEVARVAGELYDRDRAMSADEAERARSQRATAQAVEEMGIPASYLEQAAAEVHARRVAEVQARRKRNQLLGAGAAAVVGIGLLFSGRAIVTNRPAPATVMVSMAQATPRYNIATQDKIGPVTPGSTIQIPGFVVEDGGKYKADLNVTPPNVSLAAHNNMTFRVQSQGIPNMKIFFENGPTERWRSDNITLTGSEQTVTLPLDRMIHQTRSSDKADWSGGRQEKPGQVGNISFKFGEKINPPSVSGQVTIGDVVFQ